MDFKFSDGSTIRMNIYPSRYPIRSKEECRSAIQYNCGQQLLKRFPREMILEEFPIPRLGLYLDFYLPRVGIAVEVQGEQHFHFNKFFHKNRVDFHKSLKRDTVKAAWCELNEINLIYIRGDEDVRSKITKLLREP